MIPANEGLRAEMKQVFWAFGLMVFFFAFSTVMSFWVVMGLTTSIISTFIFVICGREALFYSMRIYNRFRFNGMWEISPETEQFDAKEEDVDDPFYELDELELGKKNISIGKESSGNKNGSSSSNDNETSPTSFLSSFFSFNVVKSKRQQDGTNNKNNISDDSDSMGSTAVGVTGVTGFGERVRLNRRDPMALEVHFEGYLTKKAGHGRFGRDAPLARRYFVVTKGGDMSYYKTKSDFKANPKNAIKERPIPMEHYRVSVEPPSVSDVMAGRQRSNSGDSEFSVATTVAGDKAKVVAAVSADADSDPALLTFYLIPCVSLGVNFEQHRVFELKTDTEAERADWVSALKVVASTASR